MSMPQSARPRSPVANTDPATVERPNPKLCRCGAWYTPDDPGAAEHLSVLGHRPVGAK